MKTNYPNNPKPLRSAPLTGRRRITSPLRSTLLAGFMFASLAAQAGNLLVNPGFDTIPIFGAWTAQTTEGWSMNSSLTQGGLIRTGANALWMQGVYGNGGAPPYFNMGAVQTFACAAGSTFSADAWFSQYTSYLAHQGGDNGAGSGLFTSDASGVQDGWVGVQFLDGVGHVLADYKSAILSPVTVTQPGSAGVQTINVADLPTTSGTTPVGPATWITWLDCPVKYQYDVSTIGVTTDPATESVTNVVASGILTAPPGTAFVRYFVGIAQALYQSGATYWDDCTLNQLTGASASAINNLAPSGATFFYTNTSLTFTVNSVSQGGSPLPTNPQSGVQVVVNGVDQSASLVFGGTPTALAVALPGLASNSLYQVVITVVNSAGLRTTANANFDTLQPTAVIPVETYDYNGGSFIQNPIPTTNASPDSYWGTSGILGIDLQSSLNGGPSLLPNYPNRNPSAPLAAWENVPDANLPSYLAVEATNSGVYNVDHGYVAAGTWFNYTKTSWPSGAQQAWLRCSGGNGVGPSGLAGRQGLNILTSGYGTDVQTTSVLGEFQMPNPNLYNSPQGTDWERYYWVPLTDAFGNLIPASIPSGRQTLQMFAIDGAINSYVLVFVPFPGTGLPPTIGNISPATGTAMAAAAAGFSFTAGGGSGSISSSGIGLRLNGANVTSALTFSGSGSINASYSHLMANTFYSAVINVTNSLGAVSTRTVNFDTLNSANFYVKLEDWDFNGGLYDTAGNGLVPDAYMGDALPGDTLGAVTNIDYALGDATGSPYRGPNGLHQENCSDVPLPGYTAGSDYDIGNFNGGQWANYTRNYPAGKYYVYGRLAGYSGSVTLSRVTAGRGTTSQTLQTLGTCPTSAINQGWQNWNWCLMQNNSLPAVVNVGGTNTLRVTSGGNVNANYFMLVPVQGITLSAAKSAGNIVISFPTQAGASYRVFYNPSLTSGDWMYLTTVSGDGTVKSVSDPATGNPRYYKVTSP